MSRQYVTTAIDTPNAPPHMGHAMERIMADVLARWYRLRGDEVRFQVGTDEHGLKMQRTAEKMKISPEALLQKNVPLFQKLCDDLSISYDVFFRTHDNKAHWQTVLTLWSKLQEAGKLEKRAYKALYCVGCERFMTKRDLIEGLCPNHKTAPEEVSEENWFFLLKSNAQNLRNLLTSDWDGERYRVIPEFRSKETLSLIDGLDDVSFSRPKTSLSWGIPVPDDEEQTMYVWCDALTNYISGVDIFGLAEDHERAPSRVEGRVEWWDNATVTHVIGKDIARFHALYWPAMLKHAGVRTPDRLLIHGFVTSEGQKMSKTMGNIVMPDEVLAHFNGNPDPLRFYLSHEIPVGNDGDFSWKRIDELYDSMLRNKLGNLLNRVLILLRKIGGTITIDQPNEMGNERFTTEDWRLYEEEMNAFHPHLALQLQISGLLSYGNTLMDKAKPWALEPKEALSTLSHLAEKLRHVSLMLLPFIPDTAYRISKQLNVPYAEKMLDKNFVITDEMKQWGSQKDWKSIGEPAILFPPLERSTLKSVS